MVVAGQPSRKSTVVIFSDKNFCSSYPVYVSFRKIKTIIVYTFYEQNLIPKLKQ